MTKKIEMVPRKAPLFASLTQQEMHAIATRVSKKHLRLDEWADHSGAPFPAKAPQGSKGLATLH